MAIDTLTETRTAVGTILVVDDEPSSRGMLSIMLKREGYDVVLADCGKVAVEILRHRPVDLLISDIKMPGMSGVDVLRAAKQIDDAIVGIMITAFKSSESAVEALRLGAHDYIDKPFDIELLKKKVRDALAQRRLHEYTILGDSPQIKEVREPIKRVAPTISTILITGQSGTGKELVSREIHNLSPRADRPFLAVNCAAISSNLLESELFGHERGAFTGADRERKGRFELADGGTLLLDEISEMPMPLQAKLLRILQERQFERVGSSVTRDVDVRVIATTNRNLAEWVGRGKFREDLFYRLNVLPIAVPPLRDRRDDVAMLADHFLAQIARRDGRKQAQVEPAAYRVLRDYHWPGNVRELENICERATVLGGRDVIRAATIEAWLQGEITQQDEFRNLRPGYLMHDMERQLIERTLVQFNGHREKTARTLGIGVRTLGMKLKKWQEEARRAG